LSVGPPEPEPRNGPRGVSRWFAHLSGREKAAFLFSLAAAAIAAAGWIAGHVSVLSHPAAHGRPALALPANALVTYSRPREGSKTLPSEPEDPAGLPALLSNTPVRRAYLRQMVSLLDVSTRPPPPEVGFFGSVVSASGATLRIASQPLTVSVAGGEVVSATSYVPASHPVAVTVSRATDVHLLPGGVAGLARGTAVFVGGRLRGTTMSAQLLAAPSRMFTQGATAQRSSKATARASGSASTALAQPVLSADSLDSVAGRMRFVSATSAPVSAANTAQQLPTTSIGVDGVNTVTLSSSYGVPGIDPHFTATLGNPTGNGCDVMASAEFLADAHTELNSAFQFEPSGDGFTVASLDRQPTAGGTFGPVTVNAAAFRDFSNYSVYSGWGLAIGAELGVACHVQVAFFTGIVEFNATRFGVSAAFQSEASRHFPLAGEPALTIPPTLCPIVGGKIGPLTAGIGVCETLTLRGGLFRATLEGAGGTPQGIALGYGRQDELHANTAPTGGPVRVNQFQYTAYDTTTMNAGILVDLDIGKIKHSGGRGAATSGNPGKEYFTSQRHENQIGPITPNGDWQSGVDHNWYDAQGQQIAPPSAAPIRQGRANWVHPNEQGLTLEDGRWLHSDGRWRDSTGRFAPAPQPGAAVNQNTAGGDGHGAANPVGKETEPLVYNSLHGWTYQTVQGEFPLSGTKPAELELNLPIQTAAAPTSLRAAFRPPKAPNGGYEADVTVIDAQYPGGDPTATGTVTVLFDGQQKIGSGSVTNGHVQIHTTPGNPGEGWVAASYSGDRTHAPSEVCLLNTSPGSSCRAH
jgi:hypothetical protein